MRQRYVYRDGDLYSKTGNGAPIDIPEREFLCSPMVMRDTPEYSSPIDGRPITSRSARREDLIRNSCVEADPPRKGTRYLKNKRFCAKRGLPFEGELKRGRDGSIKRGP